MRFRRCVWFGRLSCSSSFPCKLVIIARYACRIAGLRPRIDQIYLVKGFISVNACFLVDCVFLKFIPLQTYDYSYCDALSVHVNDDLY